MDWNFDTISFSRAIKDKRAGQPLRELIPDVSASTLSRLERGNSPDLQTFLTVCNWLEINPGRFILSESRFNPAGEISQQELTTLEAVEFFLRKDTALSDAQARTLVEVVKAAYKGYTSATAPAQQQYQEQGPATPTENGYN